MCLHGNYIWVNVNNKQINQQVKVDACIANEIQYLNNLGVITLGSCCKHGQVGEIIEWENTNGKWKGYEDLPEALIDEKSVTKVKKLGYRPFKYYYPNGNNYEVWKIYLKTGCISMDDVKEWHKSNGIPLKSELGIVAEK